MTVTKQTILLRLAVVLVVAMAVLYTGDSISLHLAHAPYDGNRPL